jgi:hypothetical protein
VPRLAGAKPFQDAWSGVRKCNGSLDVISQTVDAAVVQQWLHPLAPRLSLSRIATGALDSLIKGIQIGLREGSPGGVGYLAQRISITNELVFVKHYEVRNLEMSSEFHEACCVRRATCLHH